MTHGFDMPRLQIFDLQRGIDDPTESEDSRSPEYILCVSHGKGDLKTRHSCDKPLERSVRTQFTRLKCHSKIGFELTNPSPDPMAAASLPIQQLSLAEDNMGSTQVQFGKALRKQFLFDPEWRNLNNGKPPPVLDPAQMPHSLTPPLRLLRLHAPCRPRPAPLVSRPC